MSSQLWGNHSTVTAQRNYTELPTNWTLRQQRLYGILNNDSKLSDAEQLNLKDIETLLTSNCDANAFLVCMSSGAKDTASAKLVAQVLGEERLAKWREVRELLPTRFA